MLPPDLRGYAPQITGVAQTNAKVTVSQNNRIIYQENVPPGPFAITNLFNTLQGQLDVKVEEEDGQVTQWQVASNSIPYLTRKGQIRYTTAMGKPTSVGGDSLQQPGFAPIFPDICYHLTHYRPAAADIPVASDNPVHYADAIRYNARTPLQGSLLPLTRLVWA